MPDFTARSSMMTNLETADKLLVVMAVGIAAFLFKDIHVAFLGVGIAATLTSMLIALVVLPQEWCHD